MFEKEAEIEFQKLPLTEREKLVSVVQVWNKAFVSGADFGFQKCAKSRLNITTISDRPAEGIIEEFQAQIEKMKCGGNCKHLYHVNTGGCYDAKCDLTYCDCINCKDKWELRR